MIDFHLYCGSSIAAGIKSDNQPSAERLEEKEGYEDMTFGEFQELNRRRAAEAFGHDPVTDNPKWPWQNWAIAIAGETGELCNGVKKVLRGDLSLEKARRYLLEEAADIITYTDLLISALGADTGAVLLSKFNKVSRRVGWEKKTET